MRKSNICYKVPTAADFPLPDNTFNYFSFYCQFACSKEGLILHLLLIGLFYFNIRMFPILNEVPLVKEKLSTQEATNLELEHKINIISEVIKNSQLNINCTSLDSAVATTVIDTLSEVVTKT